MKTKPTSTFRFRNQRSLARIVGVALLSSSALLSACSSSSKPARTATPATRAATETPAATDVTVEASSDSTVAIDSGSRATAVSPAATLVSASPESTTPAVPASDLASPAPTSSVLSATSAETAQSAHSAVLPVDANPITNTATTQTLKIDSVLVENNVDAAGKTADDHLEISLSNAGPVDLGGVEIFYTFADPMTSVTENYYTKLLTDFTVPAYGKRVVHFDSTGQPDHFPVNKFSLYYTDKNALDVTVVASAQGAAVQTTKLQKDAGGAEAAD